MRRAALGAVTAGAAASLLLTACGSSGGDGGGTSAPAGNTGGASSPAATGSSGSSGSTGGTIDGKGAKVGIILPDRESSNRWISTDPAALAARCKQNNLQCDIQNANNDATQFVTIGQKMINDGVKVLILTALDPASAGKVEAAATKANIISIDYDRLVTGGANTLYISFDNVKVGELQGQTLAQCSQVKGKSAVKYANLNGAPTDNNATLFKQGYEGVLSKQAGWTKVADQSIDKWSNQQAGITFSSILNKNPDIGAVMVANDGMAGPVIQDLKNKGLSGKVAVSGQDATVEGLQRVMNGTQCFSIYKPTDGEAIPAVDAAATLATGGIPKTTTTVKDPTSGKEVPAILATPIAITQANVAQPINDGYTPKATTCAGSFAALCTKFGVK